MPITTATEAVQSAVQHSSSYGEQIYTAITSILISGMGAALWIRRKLSKDSLEIKKDSAEGDLMQHLEDERDHLKNEKDKILERLITVDAERSSAVAQVGKLTVEVEHLTRQVNHLEGMVKLLGEKLDIATSAMQASAVENAKLMTQLSSIKEIYEIKLNATKNQNG